MGTRVYVGNLSFRTSEESLRALCAADGRSVTEVKIVTDRQTGQPRGFAFVEFATDKDAQEAIAAMNGTDLDGRALTVNEAREREQRGGGGGGYGGGGGGYGGGGGGRDRGDRGGGGDRGPRRGRGH
ncbi:MAG: RNA recognition motif domain-containing protein [Polyangiaceae bacterium]